MRRYKWPPRGKSERLIETGLSCATKLARIHESPARCSPWRGRPSYSSTLSGFLFESPIKAADQDVLVQGLGQETERPGAQRTPAKALVGEGCHENHRHFVTLGDQIVLQLY